MKKRTILFFAMTWSLLQATAQVDVFQCTPENSVVTQAELVNDDALLFKPCVVFDLPLVYGTDCYPPKLIEAENEIHISSDFEATTGLNSDLHLRISPKASLKIAVMNYTNLDHVLRYKKLELGVELPEQIQHYIENFMTFPGAPASEKLNPYLEWELNVSTIFRHESGLVKVVPGFYYKEFNRNDNLNMWIGVNTDYDMRIRFAPPLNGEWTAETQISVMNQLVYSSNLFPFTVVESGDRGYMAVHPNKRNFVLGNSMVFPVGENLYSPYNGVAVYGEGINPGITYLAAKPEDWKAYLQDVSDYADQGGQFIRTIQSGYSSLLEFEKRGDYTLRLHYAWEQDRLLELCENRGIYIQFNLMMQDMLGSPYGGMDKWDFANYDADGIPYATAWPPSGYYTYPGKQPYEMFTNEEDLRYHEQRTRYYIARYGYSTKIWEFELLSEPSGLNGTNNGGFPYSQVDHPLHNTVMNAVYTYHKRISEYIKIGLGHTEHLVGIDMIIHPVAGAWDMILDGSAQLPTVDVVAMNYYANIPNKLIIQKNDGNNVNNMVNASENTAYRRVFELWNHAGGKPIIYSEMGPGGNIETATPIDKCDGKISNFVDLMTMGFNGVAGFNLWDGYIHNDQEDGRNNWPVLVRVQNHLNGPDVLATLSAGNGTWMQGRQDGHILIPHGAGFKEKETQYYISENKERAVGYVKNRTFNFHTKRLNDLCFDSNIEIMVPLNSLEDITWNQGNDPLWVQGLKKNTDYRIDWYDYRTGAYNSTQCQNTQNTSLKLKFPILHVTNADHENPVMWYVITMQGCPKSLEQDSVSIVENEINNPIEFEDIRLYPNPTKDEVTIFTQDSQKVIIYSSTGVVLKTMHLESGETKLTMEDLTNGVYLFRFEKQNKLYKVIKL